MNLSFFSKFSKHRKSNRILQLIDHLKKHPIFRGARVDIYTPTVVPETIVILLGQVHTVWKGKIGNRERKKIVNCQARLCSYYAYFKQFHDVKQFGGEGIYEGLETSFADRASFHLYHQIEKKINIEHPIPIEKLASTARQMLKELGDDWHKALLNKSDLKRIQLLAAAVSGLTVFNYLNNEKTKVYAVEGEKAYQKILRGVNHLAERIEKLEKSYEMRVVRQQGGKAKTEKQGEVVKQYNTLVKEFNAVIGSDLRERATLELMKEKTNDHRIVVFTMGVGHRKNYLNLADEYLKGGKTAFLFLTPPELLPNWWMIIGIPVLVISALLAFNYFI